MSSIDRRLGTPVRPSSSATRLRVRFASPASRAASTTARLSSAVGARGFWQMTAIFRRSPARTIGRWVSGGVMMSTKSGLSRSSISSKSG